MENQWQIALDAVRTRVGEKIASDDFPERIRPELLKTAVRLYPERGGKRLRPALVMWCCGAAGGNPEKAVNAAAAVEIYHNWTLVHDDIIDRDDLRRGFPTTHRDLRTRASARFSLTDERASKYGSDFAILAGDLQQAWALDMLLRSSAECGVPEGVVLLLAQRMERFLARELISGEALDVEFEYRAAFPSPRETEEMINGKTGALLAYCAECGAILALHSADHPFVRALSEFAENLGYAFQLCDDLLGIYGNEKSFGKPIGSDFREGKPTLLLAEALKHSAEPEREKLLSMLRLPEYGKSEIAEIRDLLEACGARRATEEKAKKSTEKALALLAALPETPYREILSGMTCDLLKRNV